MVDEWYCILPCFSVPFLLLYPPHILLLPPFTTNSISPKLHCVINDFSRPIKRWNKIFVPCPRTAGLTPCTPPVQRTGSTPSPFWPVDIQPLHSSLGPPSSWRAPSPSCSVPVAAKGDVKKRPSLRRQESKGTAAGSSLLALAICEPQVPKSKSSAESWATLKQLVRVVMGNGWGGVQCPTRRFPSVCQEPTQRVKELITWRKGKKRNVWIKTLLLDEFLLYYWCYINDV